MHIWNSQTLTEALNVEVPAGIQTGIIQFNSLDISKGDLFIALEGEKGNGHQYVNNALERGAAAVIVESNKLSSAIPAQFQSRVIYVKNTLDALHQLALFKREQSTAKIIAITGSVGKTSTKEIVGSIHREHGPTFISRGNFNNHLGLQINLASLNDNAKYAVFELGMNQPGEIQPLSLMLRPHIVMITNIEDAHIGFFNSLDDIAQEKSEICAGAAGGVAIFNHDCPYYEFLLAQSKIHGINEIYNFGESENTDCQLLEYSHKDALTQITYKLDNQVSHCTSSLEGKHQALNIIAGILTARINNLSQGIVQTAITQLKAPPGRGEHHTLKVLNHQVDLIDDSYNANTTSVIAALENLSNQKQQHKIAILGDMLELGDNSPNIHRELKNAVIESEISLLVTVGSLMHYLHQALQNQNTIKLLHYGSIEDFLENVENILNMDCSVLLKASNGSKFKKILQFLLKNYSK